MPDRKKPFPCSIHLEDPDAEAHREATLADQWSEVSRYERLIFFFAYRYRSIARNTLQVQDLMSEGRLGALKAVQNRNPRMNDPQWRRYIALSIRRYISEAISDQAGPIRLPSFWNIRSMEKHRPESEALRDAREILDRPPIHDFDFDGFPDPVPDDEVPVDDKSFRVREALAGLPKREREAIESIYGIGRDPSSTAEIAAIEGVTTNAISMRKTRGLKHLGILLQPHK
jgi:RNA polymerase sigma factor (sigma-70 family)